MADVKVKGEDARAEKILKMQSLSVNFLLHFISLRRFDTVKIKMLTFFL